ncbi:HXXXD-type acyl-transferase family protein [Prunus dulcis]|uniref:HXXXD-type acyl-transferase family protein n=1 Tax=Prunus dulcis TaxID=3755 RepID=A0A5H2XMH6_PRUDU|nr:HXXXD-type acyl-transferase family protein [Prunus dulcis]
MNIIMSSKKSTCFEVVPIRRSRLKIIHKETIKPSSPTPHHLAKSKLSIFDQITPEIYLPLLLFYPSNNSDDEVDHHSLFSERSHLLKTSLSEALSHFYVFAGEFEYNVSISCNDHGLDLLNPKSALIPTATESKQAEAGHLLLVQVNLFECGGMTIGVSISHKVADASTLSTFIKSWAAIALGSAGTTDHVLLPTEFDFFNSRQPTVEFAIENCVTKRFVLDASKIAALKSKATSDTVPNPTRVEAVSALIWKSAMQASRSNLGYIKPSVWSQVVNMRTRSGLSLTETCWGILCESGNLLLKDHVETYSCSSWCRFPFYEANFGWGKPSWVSIQGFKFKNTIMLMDMSDGLLNKSLSEALTHFYLFALEFVYNVSITCNDDGAAFLEAQVNCPISKILDKPDVGLLEQLLPTDTGSTLSSEAGLQLYLAQQVLVIM